MLSGGQGGEWQPQLGMVGEGFLRGLRGMGSLQDRDGSKAISRTGENMCKAPGCPRKKKMCTKDVR